MLRISKLTDYAIVILGHMVKHDDEKMYTAAEITRSTGIAAPTVSKLLKMLTKDRVLKSARGAKGGYFLGRAPKDISVANVIYAVEGPISLTECSLIQENCEQSSTCDLSGNWGKINDAIHGALEAVTLADMIGPVEIKVPIESLYTTRYSKQAEN